MTELETLVSQLVIYHPRSQAAQSPIGKRSKVRMRASTHAGSTNPRQDDFHSIGNSEYLLVIVIFFRSNMFSSSLLDQIGV